MLNYDNIRNYYNSLIIVKSMLNQQIISQEDAIKSESFLAKKYCIKPDSIYRLNDLINNENRVMYSSERTWINNENSNRNWCDCSN